MVTAKEIQMVRADGRKSFLSLGKVGDWGMRSAEPQHMIS
jgi:hypothetical protein